jgi:hypothetical protein
VSLRRAVPRATGEALRRAVHRLVLSAVVLAIGAPLAAADEPLLDRPIVWFEDDRRDIPEPAEREPNLFWEGPRAAVIRPFGRHTRPSRLVRRVGTLFGGDHVPPAANVNRLDEVPSSTWFTNRIGLFPMSLDAVARGSGSGAGPDTSAVWTIISAKTEGVTPGFNIRDANGDLFLIKFDSPRNPGMATAAGVISARILHAAGYNVPDDAVVYFGRDRLVLGEDVRLKLPDGTRRAMTEADIDAILGEVHSVNGRWRAISSRFLSGTPIGPFDYSGRREDDPNDRIDHQNRRELRGFYVFAAWLSHFDTKQHNSLDMYVEEDGRRFVKHHLIDFASTLGTGAHDVTYRWGYEYTVDVPPLIGRVLALGFHEDAWRRLERPEGLSEVGMWESHVFDPKEWKPLNPNSAFANLTPRDAYWAAKIVSAFTDAQLLAITEQARYENPEATRYVARILAERRDKVARAWFDEIAPLDFFRFDGEMLTYADLGAERGIYPGATPRYRARARLVDATRDGTAWSAWVESRRPMVSLGAGGVNLASDAGSDPSHCFIVFDVCVNRGEGWSDAIRCTVARESGRVVEVER